MLSKKSVLALIDSFERKPLLSIVGIFLTLIVFFSPVLFGDQVFKWDTLDYSFPIAIYLRDSFEIGTWPFWNPFILAGEAMFAQPAVSVYHPFHLIIAVAPEFIDSFDLLQVLLITLPFVGAFGFRAFLKQSGFSEASQFVGAVVFGVTFFGPLLGQMPIAFGIAMFPWVLLMARKLFLLGHFSVARSGGLAVLSAFTFYGSYFGVTLYIGIFTALSLLATAVWKRPAGVKAGVLNVSFAAVLTIGFICPHVLPTLENRKTFYSDISSDFISPDPRVRGVNLPEHHIVEIIPNERTLLGILFNSRELSSDGAYWVIGPGFSVVMLALLTFWRKVRRRYWYVYLGAFFIGVSYVLGPKSAVFDFVYSYVPILNNIRYPVFAFPFAIVALVLLGLRNLDTVAKGWPQRSQILLVALITVEVVLFGFASGLWWNRAPSIVSKVTEKQRRETSLRDRKISPVVTHNARKQLEGSELNFSDRSWITHKVPISHGYSTSDTPLYWYLKDARTVSEVAFCPTKEVNLTERGKFSNLKMAAAGAQLRELKVGEVLSEKSVSGRTLQSCRVIGISGKPNSWVIDIETASSSLLVLMDKNYPGWTANVDGVPVEIETVNYLFKAVPVMGEGSHRIEFNFKPLSFFKGLTIALFTLLLLIIGIVIQRLKSAHCLKNSSAKA